MVRLITHNLLACHVKGCTSNNFPLIFKDVQIQHKEAEFNPDFLRGFLQKLEWDALVTTAKSLGDETLPQQAPEVSTVNEELLRALHHVLLEIHVEEGEMTCPNCGHSYPISNGLPNMLLSEHQLAR